MTHFWLAKVRSHVARYDYWQRKMKIFAVLLSQTQTPRTSTQSVHMLCACKGGGHLGAWPYACDVHHRARHQKKNYDCLRHFEARRRVFAAKYDRRDRKLRFLGFDTSIGGDSYRQTACVDTVVHYDIHGVRQIFQALYLCGYLPRSYVNLCGRGIKSYRQSLFQILCACLPRGCESLCSPAAFTLCSHPHRPRWRRVHRRERRCGRM